MIPIPVETDVMLAILNLPKEMANNGIFKEHQGLVMEMIHPLVLQEHYDHATHDDLPEDAVIVFEEMVMIYEEMVIKTDGTE